MSFSISISVGVPYAVKTFPLFFLDLFISFAGIPITVVLALTDLVTTALAPTLAELPIVNGPNIFAPAPIITLSSTVGCLFPLLREFPPKVTPW